MTWKQALTRAINAEVAAEQAATQAEGARRQTWWDTTWALASVPRAEWGEAQAEYVRRTNHSKDHATVRRTTGGRFTQNGLGTALPQPRFAIVASKWVGAKADETKVIEAVKLLADAEKNEQSLREFNLALTGKSWTNAPENMTEAEEDEVVRKVARKRPEIVAKQVAQPAVAAQVVADPQATTQVVRQRSQRTKRRIEQRKEAIAAAGPDVKGQMAAAVDASAASMGNTTEYNRIIRAQNDLISGWHTATKEQAFNPFDIHLLTAEHAAFMRHVAEREVFIEAVTEGSDPYVALAAHDAEVEEEFQRDMDAAEMGVDIDAGLDDIEKFANEG